MPPSRAATIRIFARELYRQVELFANFCSGTYKFTEREQRALVGVRQHFDKAVIFMNLAAKLRPNLQIDQAEINSKGFTPAEHSRELATVIEAIITEAYSSIDCTPKVLRAIYGPSSRGFKDSTRFLFESVDVVKGAFPDVIKDIIRTSSWYKQLVFLRDELTHLGTGSCHLTEATMKVSNMRFGIKIEGKPLVVEDVFAWLSSLVETINLFLGQIFRFLRTSLNNTPVMQICGMVEGRMLMRYVNPTEEITFSNGVCHSYQWFEKPDAPTCPFVTVCGAYARTRPTINPNELSAPPAPPDNA